MADNALTTHGARCSWLAMTSAGQKILDIINWSVRTRLSLGSDREVFIEISTRSEKGGEAVRLEIDLNLLLRHASGHCAALAVERSSYDDAANSLRGSVTLDSNDKVGILSADQIAQRRNSLSAEKYRSERECIQEMRDHAAQLLSACDRLLPKYDTRITRGSVHR